MRNRYTYWRTEKLNNELIATRQLLTNTWVGKQSKVFPRSFALKRLLAGRYLSEIKSMEEVLGKRGNKT